MNEMQGHQLRELIRVLLRNLGVLEKGEAACCGATLAQCHAVVEIGRVSGISLNQLADVLTLDKSTTSRTVNNLVEAGLVHRDLDAQDRRYIAINLTEKGRVVFSQMEQSMEQYFSGIFASIPQEKREQVLESIELLIEAVKVNKCC